MLSAMRAAHFIAFAAVRTKRPTATRTPGRALCFHGNVTAVDSESFPVDKNIGYLPVGRLDDSAERLSRNVHLGGGLLLIQPFEVGQTDRLILVEAQ